MGALVNKLYIKHTNRRIKKMINAYASSLMIATRQDYYTSPRLTAARDAKPGKRPFRLFARKAKTDAPRD